MARRLKQSLQVLQFIGLLFLLMGLVGCSLPSNRRSYYPPNPSPSASKSQRGTKSYVINGKRYYPLKSARGFKESGIASWYGKDFHGKLTANGERYNMYGMTAAHKTLPFGTQVRVTNKKNGKSVVVRINDRGPFVANRIIDLTKTAASKLGMLGSGTTPVTLQAMNGASARITNEKTPAIQAKENKSGIFYIQTGAFSSKDAAENFSYRLKNKGAQTRIIQSDDRSLWKVQAGPYYSLPSAQEASATLKGFIITE